MGTPLFFSHLDRMRRIVASSFEFRENVVNAFFELIAYLAYFVDFYLPVYGELFGRRRKELGPLVRRTSRALSTRRKR